MALYESLSAAKLSGKTMGVTFAQVVGTFGLGGAERLALNLGSALGGAGCRSLCVALRHAGSYVSGDSTVEFFELGAGRNMRCRLPQAAQALRRLVRGTDVDVLHAHGENALLFSAAATLGMHPAPQLWFTWHVPENVLATNVWRRGALVWALKQCNVVFGASRHIVSILGRVPELRRRLRVFRNFVPDLGEPSYKAHRQPVPEILWLSRIVRKKNPEALIHAAAALRSEGLEFRVTLAGNGHGRRDRYVAGIRKLVSRLGVDDVVSMVGWVDDVLPLLRRGAIGVQCSNSEGLSMSLLEQMMAGLAVVATDVGDTAVAVQDDKSGLLIPPNDETALCAALRRLLRDEELRIRLGRAARREAVERFGPSAAVEQVAQALKAYAGQACAARKRIG